MAYPLRDLLRIRIIREDAATDNLTKAKNNLENAIRNVEKKKKELEDYKVFRKEETDRLYKEIVNKKIKKIDLDELKAEIAKLERKELEYLEALEEAKRQHEEAVQKLEEARVIYRQALMDVKKISEHKESWMAEYNKEQERIADIEMEEFKGRSAENAI